MQAQIEKRFEERRLLDHEVDTTSIDQMFQIYNGLGGLGPDAMKTEIINDFHYLEEIIGELDYESMEMLKNENPNIFVLILTKIFNFLAYLARIPINNGDGESAEMNLYAKALETLQEKNTGPDGEKPAWLKIMETIFHIGVKHAKAIDKIGEGKIPDVDMFVDILTMNSLLSLNDFKMEKQNFKQPSNDNLLI